MHVTVILKTLGALLIGYSIFMIPPALVSLWYQDQSHTPFFLTFGITIVLGLACWLPVYNKKLELRTRDGFTVVLAFWTALGLIGSIPLVLSEDPDMSFTNAVFESISGLTTTGATVLTNLDDLPKSILYYRHQLQWFGGIGIIVLAMAIFPMLGVGGMQLYRAETPGPIKDSKLTPRIAETVQALFMIYVALTVICALAYWAAGMTVFESICHAFSTIAIGGFSTHDKSIGHFNSPLIEGITVLFMIIAAFNFALHYMAWRQKTLIHFFRDPELKFFVKGLALVTLISTCSLFFSGTYDSLGEALRYGGFQTISFATTTGYTNTDYSGWQAFVPTLLIISSFVGACAGSTGGGIKAIRVLLLAEQGWREIKRLIHPNAIFVIKLGQQPVGDKVIQAITGFLSIYTIIVILLMLAMLAAGLDHVTAFSAVAASINNLGPGLGDVTSNYAGINPAAKWIMCLAMLLGRLEIFTLLVIFNPMFWRR